MEAFLVGGDPFQNLTIDLRLFLLPTTSTRLTRILMTIPRDRIWFSVEDDHSFLNRAKISIEHYTDGNWDWWPLQPPVHFLQKGQTRMRWQCVSLLFQRGQHYFANPILALWYIYVDRAENVHRYELSIAFGATRE
jgi:hypothetical protein